MNCQHCKKRITDKEEGFVIQYVGTPGTKYAGIECCMGPYRKKSIASRRLSYILKNMNDYSNKADFNGWTIDKISVEKLPDSRIIVDDQTIVNGWIEIDWEGNYLQADEYDTEYVYSDRCL